MKAKMKKIIKGFYNIFNSLVKLKEIELKSKGLL